MKYIKIDPISVANGYGVRVVLWVSGCTLHCNGCHNPEAQDFNMGQEWNQEALNKLLDYLKPDYITGLTISGGHPLEFKNVKEVLKIVKTIKEVYPNKNIWLYTGYELNNTHLTMYRGISPECQHHNYIVDILKNVDVVVDGPFIQEQKDLSLTFKGSCNQRIIDMPKSFTNRKIEILEKI